MKRIDLRVLVPVIAVVAVIAVATVAISTASRSEPTVRLTPATAREAKAVATKAVVPTDSDRPATSPQEAEPARAEAPTAQPTEDTCDFRLPIHEFCTGKGEGIDRVWIQRRRSVPTVRHMSSYAPYIVLVTVEGKDEAPCNGEGLGSSIYTPLELRTEQVLVNETGSPLMTVLEEGGVVGKDSVEILEETKIVPGKQYLLFAGPMRNRDGTIDREALRLYWAMPVNDQGQVLEGVPGALRAVPLTEALQIIRSVGGSVVP